MIDSLGDVGAALKEAKRDDVPAHRGVVAALVAVARSDLGAAYGV